MSQTSQETTEITPAKATTEQWATRSRGARFGGYLGAWVGVYLAFDLFMLAVVSGGGLSVGAFFALVALLTIPGQVIVGPVVCGALALGRARVQPLVLVLPFLLAGLPVCFGVSRLAFALYWSLVG